MNALLALVIEKVLESLLTEENMNAFVDGILELFKGKETPEVVTEALEDLKKVPSDRVAESVEYLKNILEAHSDVTPDQVASVLVNSATVKVA